MLEASNWKTMKSWYQNLFPYENDKEFPPRGGKKDPPPGTDRVIACRFYLHILGFQKRYLGVFEA